MMRNYRFPVMLAVVLSLLLSLSAYANKPLTVATSIYPLGLIAEAVVGEYGQVDVLLPNNTSPHHYALKISDRQRLIDADVVLWVGEALENFLAKPIQQQSGVVITAMNLSGIHWPVKKGSHAQHKGHDHGDRDPHLWLNPLNNVVIINALVEYLVQIDSVNAEAYRLNAKKAKVALQQLDQSLMTTIQPLQAVPFIVAHPAYAHFVDRYQLQQIDYIRLTPERATGAKHLFALRQQKTARCIFKDYGLPAQKAEQLASELTIPLYSLDPLGVQIASPNKKAGGVARSEGLGIVKLIEQLADDFHQCIPV
jgi:zinc transport system substrate-binding protein